MAAVLEISAVPAELRALSLAIVAQVPQVMHAQSPCITTTGHTTRCYIKAASAVTVMVSPTTNTPEECPRALRGGVWLELQVDCTICVRDSSVLPESPA